VFSIVELKATALDYGIPGVSPTHLLLFFLMTLAIPMIPYLFLFLSLREEKVRTALSPGASPILEFTAKPFRKMSAWVHAHRHPELLHH
jgi:hypothetical protein